MNDVDKLNQVITITENEIKFEINTLAECAKNLLTHAEQAEILINDINRGNGYYSGFFEFAEDNIKKAIKAEERIRNLRNNLTKLKFVLNRNE